MPKIRFVCDHKVKSFDKEEYTKGQVVTFPDTHTGRASAQHFLKRQLAVEVEETDKGTPKAEAAPAPPPPKAPAKESEFELRKASTEEKKGK